jgi:hypothetical protein
MFKLNSLIRTGRVAGSRQIDKGSSLGTQVLLLLMAAVMLVGCESKQNQALDQAKKQAAATGQAQQVVSVDKNGTTTTTVVQPPAAGQGNEVITTTATPVVAGAPIPAASEPVVSAVPQPVSVTIPAGTTLAIRIDQRISVKSSRAGDTFTGEIVDPVLSPATTKCSGAQGCIGKWRGGCIASPRTLHRQFVIGIEVDLADAGREAISAGDAGYGA